MDKLILDFMFKVIISERVGQIWYKALHESYQIRNKALCHSSAVHLHLLGNDWTLRIQDMHSQ